MKPLLVTGMSLIVISLSSCFFSGKRVVGNNTVETENRQVSNATRIKVLGSMEVIIDSGATAVKVEAEENILPYIITELDNNWLEIRGENNVNFVTHHPITVYITTPSIKNIKVAGSGNVTTEKKIWSNEPITIDIAGSGDVRINVNTPKVDADIAGSGNLNISGETRDVEVSIAGSGNFKGADLKAENAKVKIAGSGDAIVFADVKLNAKLVGSGSVSYKGNAEVEKKVVGSGSVTKF